MGAKMEARVGVNSHMDTWMDVCTILMAYTESND